MKILVEVVEEIPCLSNLLIA